MADKKTNSNPVKWSTKRKAVSVILAVALVGLCWPAGTLLAKSNAYGDDVQQQVATTGELTTNYQDTADAVNDSTVQLGLSFSNAYIQVSGGQTLAYPASTTTVETTKDFTFTVIPDTNCSLSSVVLTVNGAEQTLSPISGDATSGQTFTVNATQLASATNLSVAAEQIATQEEDSAATAITEDSIIDSNDTTATTDATQGATDEQDTTSNAKTNNFSDFEDEEDEADTNDSITSTTSAYGTYRETKSPKIRDNGADENTLTGTYGYSHVWTVYNSNGQAVTDVLNFSNKYWGSDREVITIPNSDNETNLTGTYYVVHSYDSYTNGNSTEYWVFNITDNRTPAPSATGIEISGANSVTAGSTTTLTGTIVPAGAKGTITWSSSDSSVATVDQNGTVTGVAAGTVAITAQTKDADGNTISATKDVTVNRKSVNTSKQTVYVYTEVFSNDGVTVSGLTGGSTFDNGTWYTLGRIYNFALPKTLNGNTDSVQTDFTNDLKAYIASNGIDDYFSKNTSFSQFVISNGLVNWGPTSKYGVKTAYGATDYGGSTRMWHLDGAVDIYALVNISSWTYDGLAAGSDAHPVAPSIKVNGSDREIEAEVIYYAADANGNKTGFAIDAPKDAGDYVAEAVWTMGNVTITATQNFSIAKRTVTLSSATDSKQYDGSALTNDAITVGGDGWADGEGATYNVTGTQTNVGSSTNTFDYTLDANTSANNYNISTSQGTLTVTNRDAKYQINVVANTESYTYDGQQHTAKGLKTTEFKVGDNTYTVSGLTTSDPTSYDAGTYENVITGTATVKDQNGNDVTDQFAVSTTNGKLVINQRAITVQAKSAEKKYDGSPLTAKSAGYEITSGSLATRDQQLNVTLEGSQTAPGSSASKITNCTITDWAGTNVTKNYAVTLLPGTLNVTNANAKFAITLEANSASATYDGADHSATGLVTDTFTINKHVYKVSGYKTSDPTQKNAGTYANEVTGSYVVTDEYGNNVTSQFAVSVKNGTLTIAKAQVTLKSADLVKEYDGAPLVNGTAALETEAGFVDGEGATYQFTGSQTIVGSSNNSFVYNLNANTLASNYEITKQEGTLTVTNRTSKYEITVTADSQTVTYDGEEHSLAGTVTNTKLIGATTYTVTAQTTAATGTNAGTYENNITGTPVVTDEKGNDVTEQFKVTPVNGSLVINKATATVASASLEKAYDGTALVNGDTALITTGFVEGEGVTGTNFTGSQIDAGSSANAFEYTANAGTNLDNYNIAKSEGALTVKANTDEITVTITGKTDVKTYNGAQQEVTGFDISSSNPSLYATDNVALKAGAVAEASGTTVGTYPMSLTTASFENVSKNFSNVKFVVTDGSLVINQAELTIAAEAAEKAYGDADPAFVATVSGFAGNDTEESLGLTYKVQRESSAENVGTYTNDIQVVDVTSLANYTVKVVPADFTITQKSAGDYIATVSANGWKYDGTSNVAPVATVTSGNDIAITDSTLPAPTFTYTDANGNKVENPTDAGTYTVVATWVASTNYPELTASTTFEVTKRNVTLTSDDGAKPYDGTALTAETVRVSGDGFANGEGATYNTFASRTEVGETENSFEYALNENTKEGNYNFTVENGTLTVTAATISEGMLTNAPEDVVYNGVEQKWTPTVKSGEATLTEGTDYTVTYSDDVTNVGTVTVTITGTGNYTGTVTKTYKITPATLVVNTSSATKTYDGSALTAEGTIAGVVNNENITLTITGSQTEVGNSNNTYEIVYGEGVRSSNYTVSETVGTLTVTQPDAADVEKSIVATGWTYDATFHGDNITASSASNGVLTYEFKDAEGNVVEQPTAAGTYTVTAKWAATNNYPALEVSTEFTIAKANITVYASQTLPYNGADQTMTFPTGVVGTGSEIAVAESGKDMGYTISGLVDGETLTFDASITRKEIGTSYTLNGNGDTRYTFSVANGGTDTTANYEATSVTGQLTITNPEIADRNLYMYALLSVQNGTITNAADRSNWYTLGYVSGVQLPESTVAASLYGNGRALDQFKDAALNAIENNTIERYASNTWFYESGLFEQINWNSPAPYSSAAPTGYGNAGPQWRIHGTVTFTPSVSIDSWEYDGTTADNAVHNLTASINNSEVFDAPTYTYYDESGNALDAAPKDAGTYTVKATWTIKGSKVSVTSSAATFTISPRVVNLSSESKTQVYNGNELSAPDVTASRADGGAAVVEGDNFSFAATGKITEVGSVANAIEVTATEGTNVNNYSFQKNEGTLTVTAYTEKVTVVIEGNKYTQTYDGTEKKIEGYVVKSITGGPTNADAQVYTENDFEFTGTASANGTDAGTYAMGIGSENFKNTNKNFVNVEFQVTDGALTINPRQVTLTSADGSKVYDGKALTKNEQDDVAVSGDGFVNGEGATYTITGSQTAPGTSSNAFTYTLSENTKVQNYSIVKVEGNLTVTSTNGTYGTLNLVGKSSTDNTYDGTEKSVSGVVTDQFGINGVTYTVSGYTTSNPTRTNAGSATNLVNAPFTQIKVVDDQNNDVTSEFTVSTENGELVVNARSVTLKSATLSKVYDGSALTNGNAGENGVTGDTVNENGLAEETGWVGNDGATYEFTGTQTAPGTSSNAFTYKLNEDVIASNYAITATPGTLTVTNRPATQQYQITLVGASSVDNVYDGEEHSVKGVVDDTFILEENGKSYTVQNYVTSDPSSVDATVDDAGNVITLANTVTSGEGGYKVYDEDGNDVTSEFAVNVQAGELKVDKRTVNVEVRDASKTYDGMPLTSSEVDVISAGENTGWLNGDGAEYEFDGSQTDVGSSANNATVAKYTGNATANNYNVVIQPGKLTVKAVDDEVVVTVKENSGSVKYNGEAQSLDGYEITNISNDLYKESDFTFNAGDTAVAATGTNVGTYDLNYSNSMFTNNNANFTNVKFVIEDGALTIEKLPITVKAGYAEKIYDGNPMTVQNASWVGSSYTITSGNLAKDQSLNVNLSGTVGPDAGMAPAKVDSVAVMAGDVDVTENYEIATEDGTLVIGAVLSKVTVTVTENSSIDNTYDGTEKTVNGYTVTSIVQAGAESTLYTEKDFTFTSNESQVAKGTNAGEYDLNIVTGDFANNSKNFTNVEFKVVDGKLVIGKRDATFTSASLEKEYDGSALTNENTDKVTTAEVNEGWVDGEGIDVIYTGSQTEIGSCANTYTYEPKSGTDLRNYNFTSSEGTLNVTNRSEESAYEITLEGASSTNNVYDGTEHTVSGLVTDTFTLANGVTYKVTGYETSNPVSKDATTGIPNNVTGNFKVIDTNTGQDVTGSFKISVKPGTLSVAKRDVTLTSASGEKIYDGSALTDDTVTATGFVEGEGATYKVTGSQTNAGSSKNAFAYELNSNTKADNYNISQAEGTLTVNPIADKVTVTITGNAATAKYDGTTKTASNYNVETTNPLYTANDFSFTGTASVSGKDANTYNMGLQESNFTNTSANFSNVEFVVTDGSLTINPRVITLTSLGDEKVYDGDALTNSKVEVSSDEFVAGEAPEYNVTGSQTYVGESENAFEYTFKSNVNKNNYTISTEFGVLKVTAPGDSDKGKDIYPIHKTHEAKEYKLGDTVTFTISATNIYNDAKTMTISEQAGVTLENANADGAVVVQNVAPGATVTAKATYTITEADILAGTFTNTATVAFEGEDTTFNNTDTVGTGEGDSIEPKNSHLTVEKVTTNNEDKTRIFQVGETIEYTVTVTNDGNMTIDNVEIDDELEGVELVSDTGETTLAPGATRTATYTYTITQADVDKGANNFYVDKVKNAVIINKATATGTDPEGTNPTVVPGETKDAYPAQNASVDATKLAYDKDGKIAAGPNAGDEITYTVTILNNGNVTLNNIYVNEYMGIDAAYATDAQGNQISVTNGDATPTQFYAYKRIAKLDSSFTLAPGESVKVTYEPYTYTEDDIIAGAVRNQLNAGGHYTNGNGRDQYVACNAGTSVYSRPNEKLEVTKTITSTAPEGGYAAGDKIDYSITVTNKGKLTVSDLVVTDELTGNSADNPLATGETLAPGESKDYTASYTVTEADMLKGATISNTAVAKGTAKNGQTVENSATVATKNVEGTPSIVVAKGVTNVGKGSGENGAFAAGDTIEYTVKAQNNGNVTLSNVVVTDELLGKTGEDVWTVAELAAGQTETFKGSYVVTEADIVKGSVVNTAKASAVAKDDNNKKVTAESTVTTGDSGNGGTLVEPNAHMTVVKTSADSEKVYALGEKIEYTVTVTNDGNLTLTNVKIIDNLAGAVLTSDTDTVATLAPGQSAEATYEYTVTQADLLAGSVHNEATATGTSPDGKTPTVVPGTADNTTDSPNGHMTVTKTVTNKSEASGADGKWAAGNTIKYTITVKNDGNLDLTNVVVTDELTNDTWTVGSLAQGAEASFDAEYEVTEADTIAGSVYNQATATGTSPDPDNTKPGVTPGDSTEETEKGAAHITVTKEVTSVAAAEDGKYVAGERINYRITVTNDGNLTATGVTVEDELTGQTGENAIATNVTLAPGQSETYSTSYVVTEADVVKGEVVNVATATGTSPDPQNPDVPVVPGEETTDTEDANGHLTITKTTVGKATDATGTSSTGEAVYAVGDTINYEIVATNDGNLTLENVVVSDVLAGAVINSTTAGTIDGGSVSVGTLAPRESVTITASYVVTEADAIAGSVVNEATGSADAPDPDNPNVPVTPGTDPEPTESTTATVLVTKTVTSQAANGSTYQPGEVITYAITATNTGNIAAKNLVITDELTGESWTIAELAAGATSEEFTTSYTVTAADGAAGTVRNVATVTGETDDPDNPGITPTPGIIDTPTQPTPTPVTPTTPDGTNPTDGLPSPLDGIVQTLQDAITPLVNIVEGDQTEVIDDDETPLAGATDQLCWIHYYIVIGILLTMVYGGSVIARRAVFSRKLDDYDNEAKGESSNAEATQIAKDWSPVKEA